MRVSNQRVATIAATLALVFAVAGCGGGSGGSDNGGGDTPPVGTTPWEWDLPAGFPVPVVPANNPMTVEGVELGRHLFYDTQLSFNGEMSCASCHQQELGFSDGRALALGSTGEVHPRNASGLTNVAYNPTLNWANPTSEELEEQLLVPLFGEDPIELGFVGQEDELLRRLREDIRYQELFPAAYPEDDDPFTIDNLADAISSFERTLISGNSPYDRYVYQGDDNALSESAKRGMDLFFSEVAECDHCHGGLNFASALDHESNPTDPTPFENNGLYNVGGTGDYPAINQGLFFFTDEETDKGRMKPPTLRNVEVSGPYMHDGSIETLEEVIEHYARGGTRTDDGPNAGDGRLNPNKSSFITGFPISQQGKADLVEFLKSLTDESFLNDSRLSDPMD